MAVLFSLRRCILGGNISMEILYRVKPLHDTGRIFSQQNTKWGELPKSCESTLLSLEHDEADAATN